MTSLLGRRWWPESSAQFLAPILLLGCYFWGIFTTLTMFDLILTFWTLVGLYSLTIAWSGKLWSGWIFFGCAIGLGVLSKGPVILVFLLPSALLAPFWALGITRPSWVKWYAGLVFSILIGVSLSLTWAFPAGNAGGEAYSSAIFWGQSAGRVFDSFAHQKPFWWYLAILPALLLPWVISPSLAKCLWLSLKNWRLTKDQTPNPGLRLALVWAVSALLILSVFSGKQPHYLLPIFPAIALACALLLAKLSVSEIVRVSWDLAPISVTSILIGITILLIPFITTYIGKPEYSKGFHCYGQHP